MGKLSLITVFVFAGTVLACEQNSVNVNQPAEPVYRQAENFTFYTSMEMYAELQNHRSDEKSEPFENEDKKEEKTEIFSLDLYDFIGDEFTVENAVFRVLNASKTRS